MSFIIEKYWDYNDQPYLFFRPENEILRGPELFLLKVSIHGPGHCYQYPRCSEVVSAAEKERSTFLPETIGFHLLKGTTLAKKEFPAKG